MKTAVVDQVASGIDTPGALPPHAVAISVVRCMAWSPCAWYVRSGPGWTGKHWSCTSLQVW
jgi:hypothetical protein